ncbi:MAG TPA: endonuclease domain-containing protein, partial [Thermoanaerobaculia bacterium]
MPVTPRYPRRAVHETRDDIFRRQYPIGPNVLDFYCHELKLAIELDGSPHELAWRYDERRTEALRGYGITVVRFDNDDLRGDPDFVAARIEYAIGLAVDARASRGKSP